MQTSAAAAAANFIETRKTRKLGSQRVILPKPKSKKNKLHWAFLLLAIFILPLWLISNDNKVVGFASQKGNMLTRQRLVFESNKGKRYICSTDSKGDFSIRVPDGTYRVYIEKDKKKITSPSVLKLDSDRQFRIQF